MSVATMTDLAQSNPTPTKNALSLIAAYIPSEAIAVYLAALGILAPTNQATPDQVARIRLICFGAGLLVAIVIAFADFNSANLSTREAYRRRFFVAVLAGASFAVYSAATPDFFVQNTYLTIGFTQWAAGFAIFFAVLIPVVAKALRVRQ